MSLQKRQHHYYQYLQQPLSSFPSFPLSSHFQRRRKILFVKTTKKTCAFLFLLVSTLLASSVDAFSSNLHHDRISFGFRRGSGTYARSSSFTAGGSAAVCHRWPENGRRRPSSSLNMVLGGGGGLFGIGTPEVVVIVLIGYFVLGPTELYKITKQIGKTVTEFRQTSAEATAAIQQNMDDSFQIDEIRRAADELNDAFSFRRSINYDDSMSTAAEEVGGAAAAAATMKARKEEEAANIVTAPEKRKKMIRRKKRKVKQQEAEETPIVTEETSLEPPFPPPDEYASTFEQELDMPTTKDDEDTIHRTQRRERLEAALSDDDAEPTSEEATFATSRFQAQMSGQWNSQILDKEEELSPIATIMNQLALLEEERLANQRRLEEEFRERGEMDEEYFLRKREVLEAGAAQIQEQAYSDDLAFSAVEQFADEGEDGVSTVSASSATSTQKSYLDSL